MILQCYNIRSYVGIYLLSIDIEQIVYNNVADQCKVIPQSYSIIHISLVSLLFIAWFLT